MVRKKIDNRIRVLIENGVTLGHRTMFIVVGEKARDQVVLLHHMLSKTVVKARPSVLWCYKKDLGFSSHRKKRMKSLQKKIKSGKLDVNEDDPFELFVISTNIRYCYYNETHKILGNTYGMCILQDFEAITPNLLARTVETVEGGGVIVLLLQSMNSLKQLYTLNMDVHQRFRTEAHKDVICRFNERFLLSLASCTRCLVVDDQLNVLPLSSHNLRIEPVHKSDVSEEQSSLDVLKESLQDTQHVSSLINCCKTVDQAKAVLKFIECISEKTLRSTVSLTAARGRGKSAALGLAIAGAITFGYSNIYISSPSPENLNTLFEFVFKGFDALGYQEHLDYGLVQSTNPEFNKATVRVNVFRDHRQTIQYIHPTDTHKLNQAELLVIDEAAAIPLPYVKAMLGPYLIFLASTINGYEGTGRSLSLKLLHQLRTQTAGSNSHNGKSEKEQNEKTLIGRQLHEMTLDESIRYKPGDSVERWLCDLLCLDVTTHAPVLSGCPPPDICQLYYINRDTLFSYHKASELFLQRLVSLYVASHYKNTPNDLQMMSDAPAHHLFCLLGPVDSNKKTLPEILVVLQVCLEGEVSKTSINEGLTRGRRAAGDLIPWTIAQQYQDEDFPALSGARIVRIATHPDYHGMGYGSRALQLLKQYYEMKIPNINEDVAQEPVTEIKNVPDEAVGLLEETIEPRSSLPPLLLKLNERRPEHLDYVGVSFGVTEQLLKFWKRANFVPVYLRQTANDITGEHSCIMLCKINAEQDNDKWLPAYWSDFRRRFLNLLSFSFNAYPASLALSVLVNKTVSLKPVILSKEALNVYFTSYDLKRLQMYSNNMADYHLIMDLLPSLARLYFLNMMGDTHFSAAQSAILLGLGLQHKTVDKLAEELNLPHPQLLGLLNRIIRKSTQYFNNVAEKYVESTMLTKELIAEDVKVDPLGGQNLREELETAAKELKVKQKAELEKLKNENLGQYAIKGSEVEWTSALSGKHSKSLISVKTGEKRPTESDNIQEPDQKRTKKKKRHSLKM
ncbi:RNA cytidine acetyltransferase [Linepithema humile]|uniref:RNA cytidine acetyltransferase n=1 Tax=Linepithema humile TaxID=83485 RepID=UPI0006231FE9|nr:PREDICTED: N-acetyltransferase 10 [Linepithema humile]